VEARLKKIYALRASASQIVSESGFNPALLERH
jgi:hypothetical protein